MANGHEQASMLAVDYKLSGRGGIGEALCAAVDRYVRSQQGQAVAEDHAAAFRQMGEARDVVGNSRDRSEAVLDQLKRYHGLLSSLHRRLPFSEREVSVRFSWKDAFSDKTHDDYSIHFEKACVLFNIGCVYNYIGTLQNRKTAEGIKVACHSFQFAAGSFETAKEYLQKHPQSITSTDLRMESLNMLISLMLAQAQETYYEKASQEKRLPAVISKLAAQTALFYQAAVVMLESEPLCSVRSLREWLVHCRVRESYYRAASHYRHALALAAELEYGQQVAHLREACDTLKSTERYQSRVDGYMQQVLKFVSQMVSKALADAIEENNTIYHKTVPDSVPSRLETYACVKAVSPPGIFCEAGADPFSSIIPYSATQSLSVYTERKGAVVRELMTLMQEGNDLASTSLASMDLPGAVQALEQQPGLPQEILDKIQSFKQAGGLSCVADLTEAKRGLVSEDENILREAIKALDAEEEENQAAIAMYGSAWTRKPSHLLTEQLRADGQSYTNKLVHAKKSDGLVAAKLEPHREMLQRLSQSSEHIVRMLPVPSLSPIMREPAVQTLRHQLQLLDSVVAERNRLRGALRALADQDDITAELVAAPEDEHERVFAEALLKYAPLKSQVERNLDAQEKLFVTISDANSKFAALRQHAPPDPNTAQRQRLCQQMHAALLAFDEVLVNLREGVRFYTRFQDLLRKYLMACKDFAMARRLDKVEYEKQARQALASAAAPPQAASYEHPTSSSPSFGSAPTSALYGSGGGYATSIPRVQPGTSSAYRPPPMPSFGGVPSAGAPSPTSPYPPHGYTQQPPPQYAPQYQQSGYPPPPHSTHQQPPPGSYYQGQ